MILDRMCPITWEGPIGDIWKRLLRTRVMVQKLVVMEMDAQPIMRVWVADI